MKYLNKSFTIPVGDKVSQEEWDRIFSEMNYRMAESLNKIVLENLKELAGKFHDPVLEHPEVDWYKTNETSSLPMKHVQFYKGYWKDGVFHEDDGA